MTRREFLMATTFLALCARGGVSCGWRENAALGAAMRKYVANGLLAASCAPSTMHIFQRQIKTS